MGRPKRVFKKKKNTWKRKKDEENPLVEDPPTSDSTISPSSIRRESRSPSISSAGSSISSSASKVGPHLLEYEQFETNDPYRIVNLKNLNNELKSSLVCKNCSSGDVELCTTKNIGLESFFSIVCYSCNSRSKGFQISKEVETPQKKTIYEINIRLIYGLRAIGKGVSGGNIFLGILNMNRINFKVQNYQKTLAYATEIVCKNSMKSAVEDAVLINDGCRDLAVGIDGSWQRRGFSSLNAIVSASSVDNGKIVDIDIQSKFCKCPEKLKDLHIEGCIANYHGTSGGMEVSGAKTIFSRSVALYNVRYAYYLGDGDSKGHKAVVDDMPYGPDCIPQKLECIGHIQKRMGTRLRNFKLKFGSKLLSDRKRLGGKNRLTEAAIKSITIYYGLAIRRHPNDLEAMKKDIWACYFHISSSDDSPNHGLCPKGPESWCKYQKCASEDSVYEHKKHFHLDMAIMTEIKSIFRDLANPELLQKCLHGRTQNPNESLNNIIWSRLPKTTFVWLSTLGFGAYEAVATFNDDNITRCKVLNELNIEPGKSCVEIMKTLDINRIKQSDKAIKEINEKAKQKRSLARRKLEDRYAEEEADDPAYGAGLH